MEKTINFKLLRWYKKNKRDLPWRKLKKNSLPNPYYVFISEYMLQQTTVSTVKKRFEEFINNWPTINELAKTSEEKILIFWSGLGYYSRARNLLKAAIIIQKNFKGIIPDHYDNLIILPGIGDYTAKAILGIAYNKPTMPVDANIERIIARIFALNSLIKKKILDRSEKFISKKSSTNLIQAFMDFGSIICTPRNPNCTNCFIKDFCTSYKKNIQNDIPQKLKLKLKKKKRYSRAYIFFNEKNEILVRKRNSVGMLASMLEVPNDNWVLSKKNLVKDKLAHKLKNKFISKGSIKYSFTHFDLETEVFFTKVNKSLFTNHIWIKKNNLNKVGLPTIMKKIVKIAI